MFIELPENMGVKRINDFYRQMSEGLNADSDIVLDFKKVGRLDLSLVQVIMAANKEIAKKGKQIKLRSVSDNVKKQLYIAGFAKF